jgi:hypothetical protein
MCPIAALTDFQKIRRLQPRRAQRGAEDDPQVPGQEPPERLRITVAGVSARQSSAARSPGATRTMLSSETVYPNDCFAYFLARKEALSTWTKKATLCVANRGASHTAVRR